LDFPHSPGEALKVDLYLYACKVFSSFDACKTTDPPLPPFPPDGPQKATPASLLQVTVPSHHFPD